MTPRAEIERQERVRTASATAAAVPEAARGSLEALRAILSNGQIGQDVTVSMNAVRAICRHHGAQTTTSPFLASALELLNDVALLVPYLVRVAMHAGALGEVEQNDAGRAIGAALLIIRGHATFGEHRITLDAGVIWDQIARVLEHAGGRSFAAAPESEQLRIINEVMIYIIMRTGIRPRRETIGRALVLAHQRGAPKKVQRSSRRETIPVGAREPSKNQVFRELMVELHLVPETVASFKRSRRRRRRKLSNG